MDSIPDDCEQELFYFDKTRTEDCIGCPLISKCRKEYNFEIIEVTGNDGKPNEKLREWLGVK